MKERREEEEEEEEEEIYNGGRFMCQCWRLISEGGKGFIYVGIFG
jgi:hypothetical protein